MTPAELLRANEALLARRAQIQAERAAKASPSNERPGIEPLGQALHRLRPGHLRVLPPPDQEPACPKCAWGIIGNDYGDLELTRYCDCELGRKKLARVRAAHEAELAEWVAVSTRQHLERLSPRQSTYTWDSFPPWADTRVLERARAYVPDGRWRGEGLGLVGGVGTNKTATMVCIYRDLVPQIAALHGTARLSYVPDMYEEWRLAESQGAERLAQVLKPYKDARWLVLDDLGAERPTPFALEQLRRLLNHRCEYNLLTCFTSNLNVAGLTAFLDERVVSRLLDFIPPGNVLHVTGKDSRIARHQTREGNR